MLYIVSSFFSLFLYFTPVDLKKCTSFYILLFPGYETVRNIGTTEGEKDVVKEDVEEEEEKETEEQEVEKSYRQEKAMWDEDLEEEEEEEAVKGQREPRRRRKNNRKKELMVKKLRKQTDVLSQGGGVAVWCVVARETDVVTEWCVVIW